MRSLFLKIFLWFWMAMALVVVVFAGLVASTQERAHNLMEQRRQQATAAQNAQNAQNQQPQPRRFTPSSGDALAAYLDTSAALIGNIGPDTGRTYLKDTERLHTFLFDDTINALKSPAPTSDGNSPIEDEDVTKLKKLAKAALLSGHLERETTDRRTLAAQRAVYDGKTYIVAGTVGIGGGRFFGGRFGDRSARGGSGGPGGPVGLGGPGQNDRRRTPPGPPPFRWYVWWIFADPMTQVLRVLAVLATTGLVCYGLVRNLTTPILQLRGAAQQLAGGDLSARVGGKLVGRRDELGGLGRDFDLMAERLQSLMKAQNRLIADISHELRSPLARLSVALGLVRSTAGEEAVEDLDRIELETERLNFMIGQLLTISRLESGEPMAQSLPVDMERLVAEIGDDADFEANSHQCSVRVDAKCSCTILGNETLLRSAVENVVRNAVRYTKDDTVVEIKLDMQRDAHNTSWAVITVRDHGEGVPEKSLTDLFRPFYRIADARDRQSGGVGLGLAITERAVRLHGGSVVARNAESGGLLVEIRLPCQADEAAHK